MRTPAPTRRRRFGRALVAAAAFSTVLLQGAAPSWASGAAGAGPFTWTERHPDTTPLRRESPAMAYDPTSGLVVMFSGFAHGEYLGDTWVWDGTNWAIRVPPSSPPGRAGAGIAYDTATRTLVLYGGFDGSTWLGDTWTWDGSTSTWTEQHPATSPGPLTGAMLFSDLLNGHVDLFGGYDGRFYQNRVWQWTGSDWRLIHTSGGPGARAAGSAELDRATRQVVVFGGIADVRIDDTWTWDGRSWTKASPTQMPPLRFYAGVAYDPRLRAVVIFGGGSGFGDLGDLWAWTGSDWQQLSPIASPSPRSSPGLAYDRATHGLVLFGGESLGGFESDTWTL